MLPKCDFIKIYEINNKYVSRKNIKGSCVLRTIERVSAYGNKFTPMPRI